VDQVGEWYYVSRISGKGGYVHQTYVCNGFKFFENTDGWASLYDGVIWNYPFEGDYPISSPFGWRTLQGKTSFHEGTDYKLPCGTPLYSTADGVVVETGTNGIDNGGILDWSTPANYVVISHANGWKSYYWHMDNVAVERNQTVKLGTYIGTSGNTGISTGCHLHFGMYKDGVPKDPEFVLNYQPISLEDPALICSAFRGGIGSTGQVIGEIEDLAVGIGTTGDDGICADYGAPIDKSYAETKIRDFIDSKLDRGGTEIENDVHEYGNCGVWAQDLKSVREKNGSSGYDGILILNPYDKNVYLIKNAIWEKYMSSGGPCGPLGVPKSTEGSYTEKDDHVPSGNRDGYNLQRVVYQLFETDKFHSQGVYWYEGRKCVGFLNSGVCLFSGWQNRDWTQYVTDKVSDNYNSLGRTWSSYKLPADDTKYDGRYTYQKFDDVKIVYDKNTSYLGPGVPLIREDVCGIGPTDDFRSRTDWNNKTIFDKSDCGGLCLSGSVQGCHVIAVAMMDAYYDNSIDINGHNFELGSYNTWLKNNKANKPVTLPDIRPETCDLTWSRADKNTTYKDYKEFGKDYSTNQIITGDFRNDLNNNSNLQNYLSEGKPVIIQIEYFRSNGSTLHAFVITKRSGDAYFVQDEFYAFGKPYQTLHESLKTVIDRNNNVSKISIRAFIYYEEKN
jgi:hypothetical protein